MAPGMKAHGKMTYNMAKEKKLGQMVQSTKENTSKVKSTATVHIAGMMALNTKANGLKTRLKD